VVTDDPAKPTDAAPTADLPDGAKPAEGTLYDDPATADLGAKVAQAWTEFGRALAAALPALPDRCTLELTLDPNASGVGEAMYGVSVEWAASGELRAYAVSNALLPPEYRLSRSAVADLVALGWQPPGVLAEGDERFALELPVDQAARLAAILSRTVRDVYGTPHPAFLMYTMDLPEIAEGELGSAAANDAAANDTASSDTASSDTASSDTASSDEAAAGPASSEAEPAPTQAPADSGEPASSGAASDPDAGKAVELVAEAPVMPRLGAARPVPGGGGDKGVPARAVLDAMPLPEKVVSVIAAMLNTTPDNLPVDKDGDIGIRSGSAMVFVRSKDNPPLVDVISPVLTDVDANEQLYVRLAELTHRMPIGRLYCTNNTVWASVVVFGRDFQASHLMLAVQVMTGLADELDDRLHGEFGGKRFFVDGDRPEENGKGSTKDGPTGMYL
jgi:hypothetical protein